MNILSKLLGKNRVTDKECAQLESVGEADLASMLTAVTPYKERIANAAGIFALGQGHRIPIAAKQGQGLAVFDFASNPSKQYKLDADDVRRLARSGISSFRDSVSKELAPVENNFLKVITTSKPESARSLLVIMADEKKYERGVRDLARDYLIGYLGLDVIDELISDLREGDENIRFYVVKVLAGLYSKHRTLTIQSRDIFEPIMASLQDSDKDVRWLAAIALREFNDARAIEPLRKLSQTDPDSRVREQALEAFNKIKG